jgi:hypothetical protein
MAPGVLAAILRTLLCRITLASRAALELSGHRHGLAVRNRNGMSQPAPDRAPGIMGITGVDPCHFLVPLFNAVRLVDPGYHVSGRRGGGYL